MSALEPPIWTLLGQIADLLRVITTAGGAYRTDLGDTVTRELSQADASDPDATPPPRIVVAVSGRIAFANIGTQSRTRSFQIVCEASFWGDDLNSQEAALDALEDMLEVLPWRVQITQSATTSSDVQMIAGEILDRPDGLPVTAAVLVFAIVMTETRTP